MVIENNAFSHYNKWNHELFDQWSIVKILDWPLRSLDINAIEHAWDRCCKYIVDHGYIEKNLEKHKAIQKKA